MFRSKLRAEDGVTLIEVLVSGALLVLVAGLFFGATTTFKSQTTRNEKRVEAEAIAESIASVFATTDPGVFGTILTPNKQSVWLTRTDFPWFDQFTTEAVRVRFVTYTGFNSTAAPAPGGGGWTPANTNARDWGIEVRVPYRRSPNANLEEAVWLVRSTRD